MPDDEREDSTHDEPIDDTSDDSADSSSDASGSKEPEGKRFSEEDVERIVKERLQRERRKIRREQRQESKTPKAKPSAKDDPDVDEIRSFRQELKDRDARDDFVEEATELGITARAAKKAYKLYKADGGEGDVKKWIEDQEKDGVSFKPQKPQEKADVTDDGKKPDLSAGAPRRVRELEQDGVIDVFGLTREQLDELGQDGLIKAWEKLRDKAVKTVGAPPLPRALRKNAKG